jgi:hypothetical protein
MFAILATAPVNRLSMDSETLGDPSMNSPVQTLHLTLRRKIVACKQCLRGDCLLLTLSLRAIKHNFLIIFNMA